VRRRRRRWMHVPALHAANHVDLEKRVTCVSISMHACGSVSLCYGAPLGGPPGRRSLAIISILNLDFCLVYILFDFVLSRCNL